MTEYVPDDLFDPADLGFDADIVPPLDDIVDPPAVGDAIQTEIVTTEFWFTELYASAPGDAVLMSDLPLPDPFAAATSIVGAVGTFLRRGRAAQQVAVGVVVAAPDAEALERTLAGMREVRGTRRVESTARMATIEAVLTDGTFAVVRRFTELVRTHAPDATLVLPDGTRVRVEALPGQEGGPEAA